MYFFVYLYMYLFMYFFVYLYMYLVLHLFVYLSIILCHGVTSLFIDSVKLLLIITLVVPYTVMRSPGVDPYILIHYSTVKYSIVQYSKVLYCTIHNSPVMYHTIMYSNDDTDL